MDSFQLYPEINDIEQIESANSPISIPKKNEKKIRKKIEISRKMWIMWFGFIKRVEEIHSNRLYKTFISKAPTNKRKISTRIWQFRWKK